MHILVLSDNFPPEGNAPATRVFEHARRWAAAGHRVTVLTSAPNFPEGVVHEGYDNAWRSVENVAGIRVVRVKSYITANEGTVRRVLDYVSFMVSATFFALFEESPDVVLATSPQFFSAVGGWLVSVLRGVPFVMEVRDLWPASIVAVGAMKPGRVIDWLERLELFLYARAAAVIVVTEAFAEDLALRAVPRSKIAVVPNGVDDDLGPEPRDEDFLRALDLSEKFVVGYVGTHGMAHALDKVLDAAKLLEDRSDVGFLFVGSGAGREALVQGIAARRLTNVRTVPRVPKGEVPRIVASCSVALIPLRDTPVFATVIPSKMFEAMALGVPILMAIPEGEATEIVRRTGTGVVVPPEDPEALARAIIGMANDREARAAYSAACLEVAPGYSRTGLAERALLVLERASQA